MANAAFLGVVVWFRTRARTVRDTPDCGKQSETPGKHPRPIPRHYGISGCRVGGFSEEAFHPRKAGRLGTWLLPALERESGAQ